MEKKSSSIAVPTNSSPQFIPTTGIKMYDEIGAAMVGKHSILLTRNLSKRLASTSICPGEIPSIQANDTIKQSLQTNITEGEKMIAAKVVNVGEIVKGWTVNIDYGVFATNNLFRTATTKTGFGAIIGQATVYPIAFVDSTGQPLTGS